MTLTQTAAELSSRVQLLTERFSAVSEQLASTAREMAATGNVPPVALSDELDMVRSEFAEVRRLTLDLAGAVGTSTPAPDHLSSLSVLQTIVQSTTETIQQRAAEEARQAALEALEQIVHLRHRDLPSFAPLEQAQASAAELRATISALGGAELSQDTVAMAENRHPFAYLVEFARPRPDLDDARWGLMHDAVAAHFGRPLAVAAARGKLVVGDNRGGGLSFSQAAEDEWPTVTVEALSPSLAQAAAVPTSIEDSVWRGLLANQPGVAFQIARLSHGDHASAWPPEWLLRALALSPYLLHVNGDLALELTDAFAQFEAGDLRLGPDASDTGRAMALLLRAAALRPSLVAPDTGAWHILGALSSEPGFDHFQHYTRVISEYGERHPALSPYALAGAVSTEVWRDTLEDLLREIGAWRVRFLGMRSSFPPAREVWRCWLRPEGLVHALLAPLTVDPRGLETARGLAERLSNAAQVRWEIGHTDRRVLSRTTGPDVTTQPDATRDLTERVREAVGFARRWIALQETRPGRTDDEPLKQARRLQQELTELRSHVVRELQAVDMPDDSLALRAALGQCLVAVSGIDALLGGADAHSSRAGQPREEPPPSLLLYRDFLRVPGLPLDEHGHPLASDSRQLLSALQSSLLRDDQPTWQEAFDARCRQHDHAATAQIIQCIELDDNVRRLFNPAGLRSARADDLRRCRDELRQHIELTRQRIDAAAACGRLTDLERGHLLASVEPVAVGLSTVLQFEPDFARLQQIRDQLPEPYAPESAADDQLEDDRPAGGRSHQRAQLAAPDGPYLVVAAPGMGTSELFQLTAQSDSGPEQDVRVIDFSADDHQPDRFWQLVQDALQPNQVRPVLLLVDEADALLEEEAQLALHAQSTADVATLFPTSSRIAAYMQERRGQLKVVLGGSLTVLRAARLQQHPLSGRGYVQLVPLLDGEDWREARVLLRRALGEVEPHSDGLVARLLSLANYEPSTIFRLGGALAERSNGGPITDLKLDQLTSSRDGARLLTETLQMTLASDARFGVVLYSLALGYMRGVGSAARLGGNGVSAAWLRDQALTWWPDGFRDVSSLDGFNDLLEEMAALGILRALGPDRFVPGRPNLIEFLGSEEELIARLQALGLAESDDGDSERDYAPAWFRPQLTDGLAGRSPLTNRQLSSLLAPTTGCAIVFGTEAGGLLSVPRMGSLTGSHAVVTLQPPAEPDVEALLATIDLALAGGHDKAVPLVMFVPPGWTWSADWIAQVQEHLTDRLRLARVIFLADPSSTARLVQHPVAGSPGALQFLTARGVTCITLGPWRDAAIPGWLAECGCDADPRLLCQLTGNWPVLLEACCPEDDRSRPVLDSQVSLDDLELRLSGSLASAFGLDLPPGAALQQLAALGESQDIDVGSEWLPASLQWASLLHLVSPVGAGRWRLDPVAARLLHTSALRGASADLREYR